MLRNIGLSIAVVCFLLTALFGSRDDDKSIDPSYYPYDQP